MPRKSQYTIYKEMVENPHRRSGQWNPVRDVHEEKLFAEARNEARYALIRKENERLREQVAAERQHDGGRAARPVKPIRMTPTESEIARKGSVRSGVGRVGRVIDRLLHDQSLDRKTRDLIDKIADQLDKMPKSNLTKLKLAQKLLDAVPMHPVADVAIQLLLDWLLTPSVDARLASMAGRPLHADCGGPVDWWFNYYVTNSPFYNCNGLQAWTYATQGYPGQVWHPPSNGVMVVQGKKHPTLNRFENEKWWFVPGGTRTNLVAGALPAMFPALSPNAERALPGIPNPKAPVAKPKPATRTPTVLAWSTATGGRIPAPPHAKIAPPRGRHNHDGKTRGSRQIAAAIFKGLDTVSELAEIIDSLYDALPDDVRKKWDREGRGMIDQAGQYGIDGADYKILAVVYNWHRIDTAKAVHNMAKNAIEDQMVGAVAKHLPVNVGRVNQSPRQISNLLDWLFPYPWG